MWVFAIFRNGNNLSSLRCQKSGGLAHVTLEKGERSELANLANNLL
jgi:predicted ribonuclease YlaK